MAIRVLSFKRCLMEVSWVYELLGYAVCLYYCLGFGLLKQNILLCLVFGIMVLGKQLVMRFLVCMNIIYVALLFQDCRKEPSLQQLCVSKRQVRMLLPYSKHILASFFLCLSLVVFTLHF